MAARTIVTLLLVLAGLLIAPQPASAQFLLSQGQVVFSGTVLQAAPQTVTVLTPGGQVLVPANTGTFHVGGLGAPVSALGVGTAVTCHVPAAQSALVVPASTVTVLPTSYDAFLMGNSYLVAPTPAYGYAAPLPVVAAPVVAAPTYASYLAAQPTVVSTVPALSFLPTTAVASSSFSVGSGDVALQFASATPVAAPAYLPTAYGYVPAAYAQPGPSTATSLQIGDFRLGLAETQPAVAVAPGLGVLPVSGSNSVVSLGIGDIAINLASAQPAPTYYAPAPAYYAAAPTYVQAAPAPVYLAQQPVVSAPVLPFVVGQPQCAPQYRDGRHRGHGRHHGGRGWKHHRGDRDDDD